VEKKETPKKKTVADLRKADLSKVKLGRYPFRAGIKYYLAKREPFIGGDTPTEHERKLNMFATMFEELNKQGMVSTTDPRHLSEGDIEEFLILIKNKCVTTQESYMKILNAYLLVFKNRVILNMREDSQNRLPRSPLGKPIHSIPIADLKKLFDAADTMIGPGATMLRGYIALAFGTGARPKEIMSAELKDLDLERKRFFVRNPKGNGSWSDPQWTPIIQGEMMPYLERFLKERASLVKGSRIGSKHLFPNIGTGEPYSGNGFRRQKASLSKKSGVEFKLKDFRSTLATYLVNSGAPIQIVAYVLRHTRIKTTEQYYVAANKEKLMKSIEDIPNLCPIFNKENDTGSK